MSESSGTLAGPLPDAQRLFGLGQGPAGGASGNPVDATADPLSVEVANANAPAARRTPAWAYVVVGLVGVLLLWRVVAVNVSAYFQQQAEDNPQGTAAAAAVASAVAWDRNNADALMREAAGLLETDPAAAAVLANRALSANPATAPAYLVLASLAQHEGNTPAAVAYLKRAAELAPQNPSTRLELANLALANRDLNAALDNLDAALRSRPELYADLYPKIMAIVAEPDGNASLRRLFARRIPEWWPAFFAYVSTQAAAPLLPLQLLDARRSVAPDPTLAERSPLIDRLAKAGEWNAAFVVWLNGLTPEQRRAAGNVFNGGFEAPFTNTTFDWQWPRANGADVAALSTFGTGGGRALRIAFQGQVSSARLVTQTLLLQPGYQYDLRGRFRLESLRTQFGLQWEVSCIGSASNGRAVDSAAPLTATDRLVGTSDWKEFTTTFNVPDDCYPQQLALVLRGDAKLDLQATGLAWYDEIQLVRGSATVADTVQKQGARAANASASSAANDDGKRAVAADRQSAREASGTSKRRTTR